MYELIESIKKTIRLWLVDDARFTFMLLLLVAVASFGLGRYSVLAEDTGPAERPVLVPTPVAQPASVVVTEETAIAATARTGQLVASVNGTKFHALNCPGAKQISEQNKIYFQTEDEAQAAGYSRAQNCSF